MLAGGDVANDPTLERYAAVAVAQAEAGAHLVAPSGMMDGQVAAIRAALDGCPTGAVCSWKGWRPCSSCVAVSTTTTRAR